MAKKQATAFNMAEEIRALLTKNSAMSGKEVEAALKKKFPRQKINGASCGVAFSNARKKLGLRRSTTTAFSGKGGSVDIRVLQAAKDYLAKCGGDQTRALAGLRQLADLQI